MISGSWGYVSSVRRACGWGVGRGCSIGGEARPSRWGRGRRSDEDLQWEARGGRPREIAGDRRRSRESAGEERREGEGGEDSGGEGRGRRGRGKGAGGEEAG